MDRFAPLLYSVCWQLQVSAVVCHLQGAFGSELRENTDRYGGLSYNVVKWPVCQSVVVMVPSRVHSPGKHNRLNHDTQTHRPLKHIIWKITKLICILTSLRWIQKLPDDGRLLPKHVGAGIQNKALVKICALCWLFLLCLIMHYTNIKLSEWNFSKTLNKNLNVMQCAIIVSREQICQWASLCWLSISSSWHMCGQIRKELIMNLQV
jgi:hypothetical protein